MPSSICFKQATIASVPNMPIRVRIDVIIIDLGTKLKYVTATHDGSFTSTVGFTGNGKDFSQNA
ncbi:hypothetical protein ACSX1A_10360 [Pontibacter sp. MBLB2868]|uniref:hypothetical protein n=1 Tax=Pontibacter sp. MBLB2868 TaxID=3451555 RepID=UPI003F7561BB